MRGAKASGGEAEPLAGVRRHQAAVSWRADAAAGAGDAVPAAAPVRRLWNRRRRRALKTTETLENAIAAAAMTGFSSPNAASGSAATL